MKVLTFCAYYRPEIAASMYITTNLFEDMAEQGIDVEVFAPTPTRGVDRATIDRYKKIRYEEACGGHLIVRRFAMMQEGRGLTGRALRYVLLVLAFAWKGLRTRADILFIDSTPPIQGVMASFLKKRKKIPLVYNLQDIFPDSMVNAGVCSEDSLSFRIGRWIENVTYRSADKIIAISEDFRKNITAKGVPEDKVSVVYNWVDEKMVRSVAKEQNPIFDRYSLERDRFYVAYCGNIGFTQNMELLLHTAKALEAYRDIRFVLIGDGAFRDVIDQAIGHGSIPNVLRLPFQPYEEISRVFSLGDVGLVISKPGVGANSVPSKTWSYMSAERPVIASFDRNSDLARIVSEHRCGICVDAGDKDGLVHAILELYQRRDLASEMGRNGRAFIERYLTRRVGTGRYLEVLAQAMEGRS